MKIAILGGGPAGLYCGLLIKKANPTHDITLDERNPADVTYGWGVVFSDRTLASFQRADYKTYEQITNQFVIWDAIDVRYRGEKMRCGGHVIASISRQHLLNILQRRCAELGINLRFNCEINKLTELGEYDLLIAADGLNSLVRKTYVPIFKPSLELGKARYIWLGANKVLDAFTFIFRENEHGLFQVHAYPFNGTTSTFIVECDEASWLRAGLDKADEAQSLAYCEQLLSDDLGGASLLSNNSKWINFPTLKTATWHYQNMVLLGDAAHTAHFSIGSGTKLAMEDAIALSTALEQHTDLETALNAYELERKPVVEIFQQAAQVSQAYFETLKRYLGLDPMQFTFQLLTRSGRISYDDLRLRDARFGDEVDRWCMQKFCGSPQGAETPQPFLLPQLAIVAPPPLFTPMKLRILTLPNRLVLSSQNPGPTAPPGRRQEPSFPMEPNLTPPGRRQADSLSPRQGPPTNREAVPSDAPRGGGARFIGPCLRPGGGLGLLNDAYTAQIGHLALSGAGLILTEITAVSREGRITPDDVGMYDESHVAAWTQIVKFVHTNSLAKIAIQLNHAGRRGSTQPRARGLDRSLRQDNWPLLSASPLPYTPQSQLPKEMDRADMKRVCDDFVRAAQMAQAADFDMLQLYFAHGYLLASFLSPLSNLRTDEYGGDLEHRMHFPLEVFDAVRATWPQDKPISVAISATDCVKGGFDVEDAVTVAGTLKAHGCDIIEVLAGQTTLDGEPAYGRGFLTSLSDQVRNEAGIATMVGGYLTTTNEVNTILAAGRADLCIMHTP